MADTYQALVTRCLRRWGFWSHKFTDAYEAGWAEKPVPPPPQRKPRLVTPDEDGRFDYVVAYGTTCAYIELKDEATGYNCNDFDDAKRRWVENMKKNFDSSLWLWLILGTHPPHYNREKYPLARRAWLLPIDAFFCAERAISEYQSTIPMLAGKGYRKALQEKKLDAIHLFTPYELTWKDGLWRLPVAHSFRDIFGGHSERISA